MTNITCCLCGTTIKEHMGRNPYPIVESGDCCPDCDERYVIPIREKYGFNREKFLNSESGKHCHKFVKWIEKRKENLVKGFLVDKKRNVIGYGYYETVERFFNRKNHLMVKSPGGFREYPISWIKEEVTSKQKHSYTESIREILIDDIKFTFFKDETIGKKWMKNSIKEIMSMSDDEILSSQMEESYRRILDNIL